MYLALDIGSEFAKAVIFSWDQEKLNVLGYGKHAHNLSSFSEGIIKDLGQLIENCELAITQASLQAGVRPAEAVIGISGEQVKGFMTIVQFERSKPEVKISDKEMKGIIEKVQEVAYENSLEKFRQEVGKHNLEVKLVNAALTHIMLDGERVEDPLGVSGTRMQIGVFNAYAPLVQLSNLQKIASELGVEIMGIAAEPYTLAEAIIPEDDLSFEALIIDIGGSTTDVVVVQHQDVIGTKVFPLGGQAVTQEISQAFEIPYEEAEELKEKYSQKQLSDEAQVKKIGKAVDQALSFWKIGLKIALQEFQGTDYLPNKILVTGGGSQLPEVKEILEKLITEKDFPFSQKPVIEIITPQYFRQMTDQTGQLESPQEMTPLSLTTMMADLLEEQGELDLAMKKGIKV